LLMNLGAIRRVIFGHDSITVLTGSPRHDATAIGQNSALVQGSPYLRSREALSQFLQLKQS
jgi:hypothetical protein